MKLRVQLKQNPTHEDRQRVFALLEDYNASQAGPEPELPLAVLVYGDDGATIVGGAWGLSYYRWLFVELMFVPPEMRGQGVGTEIMREVEAEARRRGCHGVWLDTFSFQARGFYEKMGYEVFGEIPDYPPGHSRFLLRKRLVLDGIGEPTAP